MSYYGRQHGPSRGSIIGSVVVLLAVLGGVAATIWWFDFFFQAVRFIRWDIWRAGFAPHGIFMPWMAGTLGFLAMAAIAGLVLYFFGEGERIRLVAGILCAVLVLGAGVAFYKNIHERQASYSATTVVAVKEGQEPNSLRWLFNSTSSSSSDECKRVGNSRGVQSCISESAEEGFLFDWQARTASAAGAEIVLRRATEADNLSYLMEDTLAYLNGADVWTGIRDGRKRQPLVGVVEWDGENRARTCQFRGDNALNKSFNGKAGMNLRDDIAQAFPNNLYDQSDMWGYCDDQDNPVIVIPTVTREGHGHVTTKRFGGLIVITGSRSGEPVMELVTEIEPGDYPGPVYPASLAQRQRESVNASAGLWNRLVRDFGFQTSGVQSQSANPSEYLLESNVDGRTYWVTPLRPNSTESEQIIAYSLVPADEARVGELNGHRLYVLSGDDPQVVDLQRMYNRTVDAVNQHQPAFFTGDDEASGTLTEFLPLGNDTWQAYAERGGNVVYRVEININDRITPQVTQLSSDGSEADDQLAEVEQPAPIQGDGCNDPASLTGAQIQDCIDGLVRELGDRANQ